MNSLDKKRDNIFFILGIVAIFVFWIILSVSINNEFAVPKVSKTSHALADLLSNGKTYLILGRTILKIILAISISFVVYKKIAFKIRNLPSSWFPIIKNFFT